MVAAGMNPEINQSHRIRLHCSRFGTFAKSGIQAGAIDDHTKFDLRYFT